MPTPPPPPQAQPQGNGSGPSVGGIGTGPPPDAPFADTRGRCGGAPVPPEGDAARRRRCNAPAILSVTNAIEAGTWRQGDSGWA